MTFPRWGQDVFTGYWQAVSDQLSKNHFIWADPSWRPGSVPEDLKAGKAAWLIQNAIAADVGSYQFLHLFHSSLCMAIASWHVGTAQDMFNAPLVAKLVKFSIFKKLWTSI